MAIVTQHNPAESRYTIEVDGQLAGFADYVESGTVRNFNHTVVFDEFRGQGLSKPLIKEALDDSRAAGFSIVPTCSAVAAYVMKNPVFVWPIAVGELSADSVRLRPITLDDAPALTAVCQDPDVARFTEVPQPYSLEHAETFIRERSEAHGTPTWVIELVDEPGRLAGTIDVRLVSEQSRYVDIGYMTAPWARGRGVASAAARIIADHAFSQGAHRVELKAHENNAASRRVAEKAGFTFEGMLRDAAAFDGSFVGMAVHSKLATDPRPS